MKKNKIDEWVESTIELFGTLPKEIVVKFKDKERLEFCQNNFNEELDIMASVDGTQFTAPKGMKWERYYAVSDFKIIMQVEENEEED